MIVSKSFVDLLFILLCGTIVLLSQSLRIGTVSAAPARVGGEGISPITMADVRPVVVQPQGLVFDDQPYPTVDALAVRLQPTDCVLLVAGEQGLSHHRMMRTWSEFHQRGFVTRFGVEPDPPSPPAQPTER